MKSLILIFSLTAFSIYHVNNIVHNVMSPLNWISGLINKNDDNSNDDFVKKKKKKEVNAFFTDIVHNIEHLKKITEGYDNSTDTAIMSEGFDKIEEYLLKMERKSFLKNDDFNKLRRFIRGMEKSQRKLFYKEKQNINVLKHFLPQLIFSMNLESTSKIETHHQPTLSSPEQSKAKTKLLADVWLMSANPEWFAKYSRDLMQFLEIVGDDFFDMRKLVDEIENDIMEIETSVYRSQLLVLDEGKRKHISLDLKKESKLSWLFQILNDHNREVKTLEIDLLELNELERYREFVVKFLNKKRRMMEDIDIFNESILKKTTVITSTLNSEKPSLRVLSRFLYEINTLNLLVKDRHETEIKSITATNSDTTN